MEGRSKRRNMAYKKEQRRRATKQHRAHDADSEVSALRQALQSAKKTNQKLSSLNCNLWKQVKEFKRMEITWVKQKGKLVHENNCIQRNLGTKYTRARNEINRLEEALNAAESNKEQTDMKNEENIGESQKEIEALQERLRLQMEMIKTVRSFWEKEKIQLQTNFENTLKEITAEWDSRWSLKEEKITTELKEIQEKCRGQQEEIMKKEKLITEFMRERLALTNDLLQTAIQMCDKDSAHEQSERQWKIKCEALEVRLRKEQAKREEAEKEPASKKKKRLFSFQRQKAADSDSRDSNNDARLTPAGQQ